MSSNHTDQLFKEAFDNYRASYNEKDWEAMEALLETKSSKYSIWPIAMAAAFLAGAVILTFSFWNNGSQHSAATAFSRPMRTISNSIPVSSLHREKLAISFMENDYPPTIQTKGTDQDDIQQTVILADPLNTLPAELISNKINKIDRQPFLVNDIITRSDERAKGIYGGINFSPDINSSQVSSVGYTAGAQITVPLSKRLRFNSGLMFSHKSYANNGSADIQTTAMFSSNADYSTQHIHADLNMIEIPITIDYGAAKPTSRLQPYVGVGITNYFPISERYTVSLSNPETTTSAMQAMTAEATISYNLLDNKTPVSYDQSNLSVEDHNNYELRPSLFQPIAYVGLNYQVNEVFQVGIQPTAQLATNIGLNSEKILTTGVKMHMNYRLL